MNIPELLKSKRFYSAAIALGMMVVVNVVPELADNEGQLTNAIVIVVGLLITGYSVEDAIEARKK